MKIMMEFYEIQGKPCNYFCLKRSWDGSLYAEMGTGPQDGFGNPPPGRFLCEVGNGELRVCSYEKGAKIVLVPHRTIRITASVERQLIEANS